MATTVSDLEANKKHQTAPAMLCSPTQQLQQDEPNNVDYLIATKTLSEAIELNPNNDEHIFERSICYLKLGKFQESLEDAEAAIRLNPTNYDIYYQKGLALFSLFRLNEGVKAFKKAIELRAKREDSKLSDICNLLHGAIRELDAAKKKLRSLPNNDEAVVANNQTSFADSQVSVINKSSSNSKLTNNGFVLYNSSSTSSKDARDFLTITNNKPSSSSTLSRDECLNTSDTVDSTTDRHIICNQPTPTTTITKPPIIESANIPSTSLGGLNTSSRVSSTDTAALASTPDNIYFFAPKTSRQKDKVSTQSRDNSIVGCQKQKGAKKSEKISFNINTHHHQDSSQLSPINNAMKIEINPLSANCSSSQQHGNFITQPSPQITTRELFVQGNKVFLTDKLTTKSNINKTIFTVCSNGIQQPSGSKPVNETKKRPASDDLPRPRRVMIVPSSSTPATHNSDPKEFNVLCRSARYKRLKRDRERARRGTSKLCSINLEDLEKIIEKKESLRVIAPIDGWLYSGLLCPDPSQQSGRDTMQYIVRLDGDNSTNSYLFSKDSVLNDIIKEVKINSVSELRKGARICCYWSRQYKCLSTGVVTSRTFEETKSLVSVKYDNGDLSALPLEDLRLLPPDYPKYMSNCDPLLLARNDAHQLPEASYDHKELESTPKVTPKKPSKIVEETEEEEDSPKLCIDEQIDEDTIINESSDYPHQQIETIDDQESQSTKLTDELKQENNMMIVDNLDAQNNVALRRESFKDRIQINEMSYCGVEYRPWVFDGIPIKKKKKGRITLFPSIRRGTEIITVGESAELMPKDLSVLPFVAKIESFWATPRGEMKVRVKWHYRAIETFGETFSLIDEDNALFETEHFDENDVQSIFRSVLILPWGEYNKSYRGHLNNNNNTMSPKIFYRAGYYDPVRKVRHLSKDILESCHV